MQAVVVYESMYGNTHLIADAIGAGLADAYDVSVVSVDRADPAQLDGADLVVVGGPTHVHGMSRANTRAAAIEAAEKPGADLEVEPDAAGPGLREWFSGLEKQRAKAAAFDTRMDVAPVLSGRASKGIAKHLRHAGFTVIAEPTSFLVTKETHLEPHEEARAREWGAELAVTMGAEAHSGG